jgi:hypothetical protein
MKAILRLLAAYLLIVSIGGLALAFIFGIGLLYVMIILIAAPVLAFFLGQLWWKGRYVLHRSKETMDRKQARDKDYSTIDVEYEILRDDDDDPHRR